MLNLSTPMGGFGTFVECSARCREWNLRLCAGVSAVLKIALEDPSGEISHSRRNESEFFKQYKLEICHTGPKIAHLRRTAASSIEIIGAGNEIFAKFQSDLD